MKKFVYGVIVGAVVAFVLGFNFGRDVPLWTNPFSAKSDMSHKVAEKTEQTIEKAKETAKEAIHDATKPIKR